MQSISRTSAAAAAVPATPPPPAHLQHELHVRLNLLQRAACLVIIRDHGTGGSHRGRGQQPSLQRQQRQHAGLGSRMPAEQQFYCGGLAQPWQVVVACTIQARIVCCSCMQAEHTSTCNTCWMLETRSHAAAMCMRGQQAMHTSCADILHNRNRNSSAHPAAAMLVTLSVSVFISHGAAVVPLTCVWCQAPPLACCGLSGLRLAADLRLATSAVRPLL
jgi:hypothetical protein